MAGTEPPEGTPPPEDRPPLEPLRQIDHGRVLVDRAVLEQVRAHVASDVEVEHGGILVGHVDPASGITMIIDAIRGVGTVTRSASLTFTHETWDHVNDVMAAKYPDAKMVGWYHSHPGFGIFLSDYDQFIHRNFFRERWQVAYVDDPVLDRWGFFGWEGEELVRFGRWGTWSSDDGDGPMVAPAPAVVDVSSPPPAPTGGPVITVEPDAESKGEETGGPGWLLSAGIAIAVGVAAFLLFMVLTAGGGGSDEGGQENAGAEPAPATVEETIPPTVPADVTEPSVPRVVVLNASNSGEGTCAATGATSLLEELLDLVVEEPGNVDGEDESDDESDTRIFVALAEYREQAQSIVDQLDLESDVVVEGPVDGRDEDIVVVIGERDAGRLSAEVENC